MNLLTRIALIITAALLPPLLMQAFNETALHAARGAEVQQNAQHDAHVVAADVDSILGGVRSALVATAAMPAVQAADASTCGSRLRSVFIGLGFLRGLALVDDDDRVICASDPRRDGMHLGTPEVAQARQRGDLTLGALSRGADGRAPSLPAAYPVRGQRGAGPVLVGEVDPDWLSRQLAAAHLSQDGSILLADRTGSVVVSLPDRALVGRNLAGLPPAGIAVAEASVLTTQRTGETPADMTVRVAPGPAEGDLAVNAAAQRGYALIGVGFLIAFGLAAWMARDTITRPVRAILAVTERWQGGDTAARLRSPDPRSEFGRIAAAINALLDAVAAVQAGLHERLAELAAIYDGSPVGLGYIGHDLRFITVNARLAEIDAVPAQAHRGRTVREIQPSVAGRIEPLLQRALAGEALRPAEVIVASEPDPAFRRRLLVSYQPAVDPAGRVLGVVIAVQDVTALRRAEEALRTALQRSNADLERLVAERTAQVEAEVGEREAAQAQLQQAQKMEVIGQLTGGVAHDFNNLLTAIIGNLELAAARSRDRPELQRLLSSALRAADRGASLTQRMLAFGRRQYLRVQPVAIPALLEGMADLIARTIGPAIAVRIDAPHGLRPARVDPNQVELVVLNLVVNARDAMPEGGRITILAAEEQVPPDVQHPASLKPGDYVRLSVSDTGEGMNETTRVRAFEPYFTTKPVGHGSGLGLSMVQGVAAQSEGGATLESAPGRGTTVTIWLPCAEAVVPAVALLPSPASSASSASPASPAVTPTAAGRRRVLFVDDDAEVADFAAACLEEAGYAVSRTSNGGDALRLLTEGPLPDLLIADLGMPGMNGLQLAAAARQLWPDLPILIATGYATQDGQTHGPLDVPVLGKPFKASDLLGRVTDLLGPVSATGTEFLVAPRRALAAAR